MRLPYTFISVILLAALITGCASSTPRMREVRDFAAESAKLNAYAELTERFRTTYQRERPYLSPAADLRERELDARRQDACDDFITLQRGVQAYMRALGALAGDNQYDLEDQVKSISGGIKAWPDTGLDDRHVNAYAGLTRLLLRVVASHYQDTSVQALVRESQVPLQQLLEAMRALLRYYDKTSDNEARIVLGMLEVEIAYADSPPNRLLVALARAEQQAKTAEYRLAGRRHTLAGNNLDAIAAGYQALLQHLDQPDSDAARGLLERASAQVRGSRKQLAAGF